MLFVNDRSENYLYLFIIVIIITFVHIKEHKTKYLLTLYTNLHKLYTFIHYIKTIIKLCLSSIIIQRSVKKCTLLFPINTNLHFLKSKFICRD